MSKTFTLAADVATLFASILASESINDDIKNVKLVQSDLEGSAFTMFTDMIKAHISTSMGADAPTKAQVATLADDYVSTLQAMRTQELASMGLKTKDVTGRKDAVCNRLAVWKGRIASNVEKAGQVENLSPEQKKALKEEAAAKKSADEALSKAQAAQGMAPATIAQLIAALSTAVQSGALSRAEWGAAHHLALRIETGYSAFHGTDSPVTRHMGDVVEVSIPVLTH